MESPDSTYKNIELVGRLFPSTVTEHKNIDGSIDKRIDFDRLKLLLSPDDNDSKEKYEFLWPGKGLATRIANTQTRNVLRPRPAESKNWEYTSNIYIQGDNLEVLKILQESYLHRIGLIYIDPPYNTGKDFIYNDKFGKTVNEYESILENIDEENDNRLVRNQETNGRFHSDWCSMIYSRLLLANNLLSENGALVISIGYNELSNLMKICQELFPSKQIFPVTLQTSGGKPNGAFNISTEYLVFVVPFNFQPIATDEDMKEYASAYHGMNLATFNQTQRPNQAYPIYVDKDGAIIGCGKSLQEKIKSGEYSGDPADYRYCFNRGPNDSIPVWPITTKGEQCVWRLIPERLMNDWNEGYIKVVPQKTKNGKNVFSIQYLSEGIIDKIKSGDLKTYRISSNPKIPTLEIEEYKTAGSGISSIWADKNFYTAKGNEDIKKIFGKKVFSYPKPVALIKYILRRMTQPDDIILDFFSGSATTAQATMELNFEDGGNRQFILVQLPERCEPSSEASKMGFQNICEIGEERIRIVGNSISSSTVDTGFRVFSLDTTNMKEVYYSVEDIQQDRLFTVESNIKEDRTDLDLLFACLLEWGLELSKPNRSEEIAGVTVHTYDEDALVACFAENVPEEVVREIAKRQPLRAVFRDSSFGDDAARVNLGEIFKLLSPDTEVKVL